MRTFKVVILTLIAAVLLGVGGALVVIYSGAYNVTAMTREGPVVAWFLSTASEHSVAVRASSVKVPSNLGDPQIIMEGFKHYREMCVGCHRKPGLKETEMSKGLDPEPPNFSLFRRKPDPKTLFWVAKNGIRFTGMPAWGLSHDDQKIWALVAFIETLPGMTPQQWQAMDQMAGPPMKDEDEDAAPEETHHHHSD